ncbi:FAD/NAD(P)-binding oxidoreductase [Phyllobacterium phragmitis]|uniref:FAD/NAD(P)-binding oxidoreductase n=1 Tax=Phyllobacterium phragmitis TaxID=2670329 RepID=A0A2S9IW14_9HYPH|nr:FAD/NAD(P)-binding oxidoreductase [Phyllobacterium phragmitis]PRD44719.1 FAD/NAD(P)-binding oxidoreductase [Phyllobacterium phragmitis]
MKNQRQPLIVGAGPAGVRAAQALVAAGLRPLVVDEAPACGGQIYRQRLIEDGRSTRALYGSEAPKAERLHRDFAALSGRIDYWPQALVWNLDNGKAHVAVAGVSREVVYDGLILATGASDRVLPVPGWTLPGVFTLGGAQIALKAQGCAIGSRVVFAGCGPLLYLVAWQYMKAGVDVAAVLDAAPLMAKRHLLRGLALAPGIVLRGMRFVAELKLRGVAIHHGIEDFAIEGETRVTSVRWRQGGRERNLPCDGIGYGLSLRSETQLADLAGCAFSFNARDRAFLPQRDISGRSSIAGVYLAGDGAGIAGADAAELAGERAALALLEDRDLPYAPERAAVLERKISHIDRFRDVLEAAFPYPAHWAKRVADETLVCRCEEVSTGTLRQSVRDFALDEVNRLKAVSRIGMGRCQGRFCGAAAAEILGSETGQGIEAVGRLRAQAPVKPLPLTLKTEQKRETVE